MYVLLSMNFPKLQYLCMQVAMYVHCMYVCLYIVCTHVRTIHTYLYVRMYITHNINDMKDYKEETSSFISNSKMKTLHYYPPVVHHHQLKQSYYKVNTIANMLSRQIMN